MQDLVYILRSYWRRFVYIAAALVGLIVLPGSSSGPSSNCQDQCDSCLSQLSSIKHPASQVYEQIPLSFEANEGQAPDRYSFLAHGTMYDAYFGADETTIQLHSTNKRKYSALRMTFGGATSRQPEGVDVLPGRANYFIGNNPSRWQTNVASFAKIRYQQVYPGVDLVYYGRRKQLENDLVVAPGADPSAIEMRIDGADGVDVDRNGDLLVRLEDQEVRWRKPAIYQDDRGTRRWIDGGYRIKSKNSAGFQLGAYDRTKPLVIDPVLAFSTFMGRVMDETGVRIMLDSAGNIVVLGVTTSDTFPVQGPLAAPALRATTDAVVLRMTPDGSTLLSSTVLGGTFRTAGVGLGLDGAGNIYVAGATMSADYPTTAGSLQPNYAGGGTLGTTVGDGFVTKLDPTGSKVLYSTYLGGSDSDGIVSMAVDSAGNAYVTGGTTSNNFPTTPNAFQTFYKGSSGNQMLKVGDAFVAKLNPQGTALVYSTLLGGSSDDVPSSIAIDSAGIAYIGGYTSSLNFPVVNAAIGAFKGAGLYSLLGDGFVTAVKADGTGLVYSTYLGGRSDDGVTSVAVDSAGNLYVTGYSESTDFPIAGAAAQRTNHGSGPNLAGHPGDAFLTKFNKAGAIVYSTYLGGSGDDSGMAVTVDANGSVYVAGFTASADFPMTAAVQGTYKGSGGQKLILNTGDAFVTTFNSAGAITFSTYLGGAKDDAAVGIAVDAGGSMYVTGNTLSPDFPVTDGVVQRGFAGGSGGNYFPQGDMFIARIGTVSTLGVAAVVNAASYALPPVAPGEAVTVYGFGMGPSGIVTLALDAGGNVATNLAGARLLFDGVPAPLIYVSAGQSSAFVPYSVSGKTTTLVEAEYNGVRSVPLSLPVAVAAPGFFTSDSSGKGQGAIANQDGTLNSSANPASAGSVIALYGTGEGQTVPPGVDGRVAATIFPKPSQPVLITIGGISTFDVPYYGAAPSASAGVFQVNVRIPSTLGSGNQPVVVTIGGVKAAPVNVAVK